MAVDTRNKRASAIGVGLLALRLLPLPDGEVLTLQDRRQVAVSYAGDAVAAWLFGDAVLVNDVTMGSPYVTDASIRTASLSDVTFTVPCITDVEVV